MADLGVLVTASLPVVGIIIGAALQHWFSRSQERRKQTEVLRDQAYADYLRAMAQIDASRRAGRDKTEELIWRIIESKARIAIYGTTDVGQAMVRFHKAGASISGAGRRLFLELCQAMRADSAAGQKPLTVEELQVMLLETEALRPDVASDADAVSAGG